MQVRGQLTPGEEVPGTYWIGGWMGPRAGLDTVWCLIQDGDMLLSSFYY